MKYAKVFGPFYGINRIAFVKIINFDDLGNFINSYIKPYVTYIKDYNLGLHVYLNTIEPCLHPCKYQVTCPCCLQQYNVNEKNLIKPFNLLHTRSCCNKLWCYNKVTKHINYIITNDNKKVVKIKSGSNDAAYYIVYEKVNNKWTSFFVEAKYTTLILLPKDSNGVPRYGFEYDKDKACRVVQVHGFKTIHWITDTGMLISKKYRKVVSFKDDKRYQILHTDYTVNGKRVDCNLNVHRAVATAFIPNPENKPQVNHIDGVKNNNHYKNLEWVTHGENQIHAYRMGLKPNLVFNKEQVLEVHRLRHEEGLTHVKIANIYNVNDASIRYICTGKNFKDFKDLYYSTVTTSPAKIKKITRGVLTNDKALDAYTDYHKYKVTSKKVSLKYKINIGTLKALLSGKRRPYIKAKYEDIEGTNKV